MSATASNYDSFGISICKLLVNLRDTYMTVLQNVVVRYIKVIEYVCNAAPMGSDILGTMMLPNVYDSVLPTFNDLLPLS